MLDLLRFGHAAKRIPLTEEFICDLRWFSNFLPTYNGVSMYDHSVIDVTLELDACLTGLGGRCGDQVYHLPIERGYL